MITGTNNFYSATNKVAKDDGHLEELLNTLIKAAWRSLKNICYTFLVNNEAESYCNIIVRLKININSYILR